MSRSQSQSRQLGSQLSSLIATAAAHRHHNPGADVRGAVMALAAHARQSVLTNGIVICEDVREAVDAIAVRHLGLGAANRALSSAFDKVSERQVRSAIEIAHDQVLDLSEVAHYYAGLTSGIALVELSRNR